MEEVVRMIVSRGNGKGRIKGEVFLIDEEKEVTFPFSKRKKRIR